MHFARYVNFSRPPCPHSKQDDTQPQRSAALAGLAFGQ